MNFMRNISIHQIPFMLISLVMALLFLSCSPENDSPDVDAIPQLPASFSFFDVDVNTPLSRELRKRLGDILGDAAISNQNIMDLSLNLEPDFLESYFPRLDQLNRLLNSPPGERVEHNTTKITYRYAVKKNLPFTYVELLFSKYTRMPLIIRVLFKTDTLNIQTSLEEKYGSPMEIPWKQENGRSLFWKKNDDFLFYCFVPNQFGIPEYRVTIYFTHRIASLLEMEGKIKKQDRNSTVEPGKAIF
jgi:hypothetical protein